MKFLNWLENKENTMLSEAAFGSGKTEKAAKLIAAYLAKKHFGQVYQYGGKDNYSESYKKSNGKAGIGYRFISDSGKMFRVDFDTAGGGELTGVTLWNSIKKEHPDLYIEIPKLFNSIPAIQYILTTIIEKGSAVELNKIEESVNEAAVKIDLSKVHQSLIGKSGMLKKFAWDAHKKFGIDIYDKTDVEIKTAMKAISAMSAGPETTSRDAEYAAATSVLASKKYADVDTIFDDLAVLVKMVLTGNQPSILVTGSPGTGKTYSITDIVSSEYGAEGNKWTVAKGKVTPLGLYSVLFSNRNKLVIFDDSDSVFKDKDAVNILKAALDSYDKRMLSWFSKATQDVTNFSPEELMIFYDKVEDAIRSGDSNVKLPNKFEFTGKIIFISNLEAHQIDSAIKSRSFVIDITLSREDIVKRIESILPKIGGNTALSIKKEALEALKEYEGAEMINMRSFLKALRIRETGAPRWKELIIRYI